ncbi:MAG TPA: ribose-phosphate diphosphokinase [Kofleriaceae bacterium]|nr:ribose-phosphate diphosphokinase [Kofleriaceae bacterium]
MARMVSSPVPVMKPLVIALPGNEPLARRIAEHCDGILGGCELRRFPDGEEYLRLEGDLAGRSVVIVCTLHPPHERAMVALLVAAAARDLGAARVGLVAPYLAYMRQDERFRPGEAVTSGYFARLISGAYDWLVTVDPHLHRHASLDEIYTIPTRVIASAPDIASWLIASVDRPFLIGPDAESEQWVGAVARAADAPFAVLAKTRRGDREVEITAPDPVAYRGRTPVIVDDIISTGSTMLQTLRHLTDTAAPLCIGVHAVFAGTAHADLVAMGVRGVATCNTIAHPSNAIDVSQRVAEATAALLKDA